MHEHVLHEHVFNQTTMRKLLKNNTSAGGKILSYRVCRSISGILGSIEKLDGWMDVNSGTLSENGRIKRNVRTQNAS